MTVFNFVKKAYAKLTHKHVFNMRQMETRFQFMPTGIKAISGDWFGSVLYDGYFRVRPGYLELCECGHRGNFIYETETKQDKVDSEVFMRCYHNGGTCHMITSEPQSNPDYYDRIYKERELAKLKTKNAIQRSFVALTNR